MAPNKKSKQSGLSDNINVTNFKRYLTKNFMWSVLLDPRKITILAVFLLIVEIVVNVLVINKIRYTEIDWIAYMQEVEGVINGTFDYSQLKGDTGPLVYPAGFVYIFSALYYFTDSGKNVIVAQYLFAVFYIVLLYLVYRIYKKSKKVPPYALLLSCCTSYRIHSIFVLRMFNDPVAVILLYLALNLFLEDHWSVGSVLFSLAVSVKMNILLYAPALLLAYWYRLGFKGTVVQLSICGGLQVLLGLPFLLNNPVNYVKGAFNLGRVFIYQWTVNWRFLPESLFLNSYFHILLLGIHIALLLIFLNSWRVYFRSFSFFQSLEKEVKPQLKKKENVNMETNSQLFLLPMFTCNFIGMACSRSLHYQFYVWYFHTLPYLLWSTPYSNTWRLIIMGVIELCWNTYPSTSYSSLALHISHLAIIYGLYRTKCKKL